MGTSITSARLIIRSYVRVCHQSFTGDIITRLFDMEHNRNVHEEDFALQLKALRRLSEDKLDAIKYKKEHLLKVICLYNTLDLLAEIRRRNRKRRHTNSLETQQLPPKRPRLDRAAQQENDVYKQELDEMFNDLLTPPSIL